MARVCILISGHWEVSQGGSEYQAHCLAQHLSLKTNHEVFLVARYVPTDESRLKYPYQIRQIPGLFTKWQYGLFWDAVPLQRTLDLIDPAVVIQRLGCAYTGIAARYCKKHGKPMIWSLASDMDVAPAPTVAMRWPISFVEREFMKYGIRNASHIVAQTHAQAFNLRRNYGREVAAVIPNFHDVPPGPFSKAESFTVLWVANLKELKQPEQFVRLARELRHLPNTQFKMIGASQSSVWGNSLLKEIASIAGLEYLGARSIDDVNAELERAHVFVNTSVYEGFPNTFVQAWMREVPTLSLNVDPDGIIQAQGLGYRTESLESLARRVTELYENRELLRQMSKRAREFAVKTFSPANGDQYATLIDHVVERQRD